MPNDATVTITNTSSRAALELSKLCRKGISKAQTAKGTTTAAVSTEGR
jgi:hypothetical protein